jgi:hypothetical protein
MGVVRDGPGSAGKLSCSQHRAGGPDRANYAENGGTFGQRFFNLESQAIFSVCPTARFRLRATLGGALSPALLPDISFGSLCIGIVPGPSAPGRG